MEAVQSIEPQYTSERDRYPLRGLWQAARRHLHLNSCISIHVCNEQGRYDKVAVARDETELRMVWDSLVLPSVQARRDVWITDIGNLMVN